MEWKIRLLPCSLHQLSGSLCRDKAECLAPCWIVGEKLNQAPCSIAPGEQGQRTGVEDHCKGKAQQFHWGGVHSAGCTLPWGTDGCEKSQELWVFLTASYHSYALPGQGPALSKLPVLL